MLTEKTKNFTSFEIINLILSVSTIILSLIFPQIDKIYGGISLLLATLVSIIFIIIIRVPFKPIERNILQAHIFISIFLGTTLNFYKIFNDFDFYLHLIFGFVCSILSIPFIRYFIHKSKLELKNLTLFFIIFIIFCFSMTCGALWEIYEFSVDMLFNLNTQNNNLLDTMSDIIANTIGTLTFISYYYIRERKKQAK